MHAALGLSAQQGVNFMMLVRLCDAPPCMGGGAAVSAVARARAKGV